MKIPYGIADFYHLRTAGYHYVDRTARITWMEDYGEAILFLRPRRFGKSLWLRTLACYYDLRLADEHERLFGDLAIGRDPTPLAHRYFVLPWDFSKINPDPPPRGVNTGVASRVDRIGNEIHRYLNSSVKSLVSDYRDHLPEAVAIEEDAFSTLENLLDAVRRTPYRLYVLVDEYDNFANEVMAADPSSYGGLVHSDGPFKFLFKWVKGSMSGQGLERLFITGVSPIVMSDVTSGLNIAEDVYLEEDLNALCGFTTDEVERLVRQIHAEKAKKGEDLSWSVEQARETIHTWYNGYRFARRIDRSVYNPTLVLYFLKHLQHKGDYPHEMLDTNLAADEDKLKFLGQAASGRRAVIERIRSGEPLEIFRLEKRFTLSAMLERSAQDATFLGSYLFYFGMLTLEPPSEERRTLRLSPPNLAIRKLYFDQVLRFIMPLGDDRSAAQAASLDVMRGNVIEPLLDVIERTVLRTLSNRDSRHADELMIKTIFICLLWNEISYVMISETELERGYADLCLLRRPDARNSGQWDLLFEFKRLSLSELEMTGEELRSASRTELMELEKVQRKFGEAEEQLRRYRRGLERRYGADLRPRVWAVVALGFDRLLARNLGVE